MKKTSFKGQAIVEYALIGALIIAVTLPALQPLASNVGRGIKNSAPIKNRTPAQNIDPENKTGNLRTSTVAATVTNTGSFTDPNLNPTKAGNPSIPMSTTRNMNFAFEANYDSSENNKLTILKDMSEAAYVNSLFVADVNTGKVAVIFKNSTDVDAGEKVSFDNVFNSKSKLDYILSANAWSESSNKDIFDLVQSGQGAFTLMKNGKTVTNENDLEGSIITYVSNDGKTIIPYGDSNYTYHSLGKKYNHDGFDHAKIVTDVNGKSILNYEDLPNGGDEDFNDIVVDITAVQNSSSSFTSDILNTLEKINTKYPDFFTQNDIQQINSAKNKDELISIVDQLAKTKSTDFDTTDYDIDLVFAQDKNGKYNLTINEKGKGNLLDDIWKSIKDLAKSIKNLFK